VRQPFVVLMNITAVLYRFDERGGTLLNALVNNNESPKLQ